MPFLRLTRDRRGAEHTFLMHASQPGERARVLYWYRTAPELQIGRSPLDEEAIRTIEDQHPDIDFDWPAILALSGAMMPEDEPAVPRPHRGPKQRPPRDRERGSGPRREREVGPPPAAEAVVAADADLDEAERPDGDLAAEGEGDSSPAHTHTLLEELVGREIATRLHARYAEICARIHERHPHGPVRQQWMARADGLDPDTWLTPEAVLEGVRQADALFDRLRAELLT